MMNLPRVESSSSEPQTEPTSGFPRAGHSPLAPQHILSQYFGHEAFRYPQAEVIDRALAGLHSMVILPTGGGKSLCFQIPAMILNQQSSTALTVVLSPLVSLMKDQVDRLRALGIDAIFINSSLDRAEREARYAAVREGRHCLLYVTPERFRKPEFLEVLAARRIALLAIDEAHCISQWGHDFRPDYSGIARLRDIMGQPTTICLTATATPDVQRDILVQAGLPEFGAGSDQGQLFHLGIDRPNLALDVEQVWGAEEKLQQIVKLVRQAEGGSSIIYFTLIKTLLEFSHQLDKLGIAHVVYHGDLERRLRRRIQEQFMSGEAKLVLATNAFGMGIDKEDIRLVVHADVPGSLESYYQEVGRAGRDGQPSRCVLLYDQHDLATQMEFIVASNPDADFYCRAYDLLLSHQQSVQSFGFDWLHQRLCGKNRHDRRLETVLGMFMRYGLIDDEHDLSRVDVQMELPHALASADEREAKLRRDQRKLYAIVEYIQAADRAAFLREYFGV